MERTKELFRFSKSFKVASFNLSMFLSMLPYNIVIMLCLLTVFIFFIPAKTFVCGVRDGHLQ